MHLNSQKHKKPVIVLDELRAGFTFGCRRQRFLSLFKNSELRGALDKTVCSDVNKMNKLGIILMILVIGDPAIRCQEYFLQGPRPVYIVSESGEEPEGDRGRFGEPSEFLSRSGLSSSEEEGASRDYEEAEASSNKNGSSKLPLNFSEEVNKNRRIPPRRKQILKADPAEIDREEYEEPSVGTNPRGISRFLWPFSVSVSKGGKGHDHGHGHVGYYHSHYPKKGKGHHHGHFPVHEPFKGLTEHDYEILESKGYKKYQLKKKKKIKKLKKKLKLKRILQKILEKKINYFDSLGIEGGGWD